MSQIKKLQYLDVSLVYLFGSYAEEKGHPLSDIDIAVVFSYKKRLKKDVGKIYNELYFLFSDIFMKKNIDIIFLQKASLELRFDVIRHGKIIYRSSEDERLIFEDQVAMLYMDFKPILNEFNEAILSRI
ncbi:MAG: nucleotidyltransferase domain-containing protein [Nitrospinae bacterium]|nr:nucleotidyltransferase domain-containing protein [Nitrospinota bacterium]